MLPGIAKPRRTNGNVAVSRSVRVEQPRSDESLDLSYLGQELHLQMIGVTLRRDEKQHAKELVFLLGTGGSWVTLGLFSSKVLRLWQV